MDGKLCPGIQPPPPSPLEILTPSFKETLPLIQKVFKPLPPPLFEILA